VKIGLKFQPLGKISNISTSDPPPSSFRSIPTLPEGLWHGATKSSIWPCCTQFMVLQMPVIKLGRGTVDAGRRLSLALQHLKTVSFVRTMLLLTGSETCLLYY